MSQDLLIELGTEELPPKALANLAQAFYDGVIARLNSAGLSFTGSRFYAAPRRMAIIVDALAASTPKDTKTLWGPPAKIAFDDQGQPTKAALAFAKKNGLEPSQLATGNDGKVDKLMVEQQTGGEATTALIPGFVEAALAELPIPKRMRWGASKTEFVRPAHWLVLLYGNDVIDGAALGKAAGRSSRGHRFHSNAEVSIHSPSEYQETMRQAFVMVDHKERRETIQKQVEAEARAINGRAVIDADLLIEVTALVEWPVALTGQFDREFLEVPQEALISSMAEHQKYFHAVDSNGQLLPNFITVANIESRDPQAVIGGNERVIRPRLADAAFFFETDKKTPFGDFRKRLENIVFQAKLGSIFDKTERVAGLAAAIAEQLGLDAALARRAGELSKCDLASEMVLEFDKMQGIAGRYYAAAAGEDAAVAQALEEQYLPKFAGDKLPASDIGTVVALADRLDTLVGIFGIGQQPTGSKDPFALRRASVAVLRLLIEKDLNLDLVALLEQAQAQHQPLPKADGLVDSVATYMLDRLRAWYEEAGISAEVFQAVAAKGLTLPRDINQRVYAVAEFTKLDAAQALAAANKRVSNILAKQDGAGVSVNPDLFQQDEERALADALAAAKEQTAPSLAAGEYAKALTQLANLREPVDAFFDSVMVMADDQALKDNRLALLTQLRALFLHVADISLLAPAK